MIKYNDLAKQYKPLKKELTKAFHRVLDSNQYILGKEVEEFEKEFSKFIGTKYAVGVANGTDAITLSLLAHNIGQGDEVIVPSFGAYPTVVGVKRSGATPIFVDVGWDGLIDVDLIATRITSKTKAIVPVHLYGRNCQIVKIRDIAKKTKLKVIEDCAQSCGVFGTGMGSDCHAFSFYPTKILGCIGDGGAITTNDEKIYLKLKKLRNYNQEEGNGFNSRLDELQAAFLRIFLKQLPKWILRREEILNRYYFYLPLKGGLQHCVTMKDKFIKPDFKMISHYPYVCGPGTIAKYLSENVISLPLNPTLTNKEIDHIIQQIS